MTILVSPSGHMSQINEHLDRLRRLVTDVEALACGRSPDPAMLADAPELANWTLAAHATPCLVGEFLGHPKIRYGQTGKTSDLWIFAPSHGYARTLSRFYRLGTASQDRGAGR